MSPPSAPSDAQSGDEDQPSLVTPLHEIEHGALDEVGGKALNLAGLLRGGFRVPPGFCITTSAYRRVTDHEEVHRTLDDLAATGSGDASSLRRLADDISRLVLAAPVPEDIATTVLSAYRQMGHDVAVAVRSSATAEDLPFASFAGQQDTFLGVVGEAALLQAVRRCWASLWTARAVSYRAEQGIDPRAVRLAVVVQQMVDAEVAGVLFTADPVTGRRHRAVIDASPGLGEAVVSGAVNPDHLVVDSVTGAVLERRPGDKRVAIRARPGGGTTRVEVAEPDDSPCLSDEQLRDLAALGLRVEQHFGSPQDIEWAIDHGGTPWLTQTRPITTLYPLPANAPPPEANRRVYFCLSVAQGLNRPITPMGLATFRLLGSSIAHLLGTSVPDRRAGPPMYADPGRRLFVDLTEVLRSRVGRALMPRVLDQMEARSAVILRSLLDAPDLTETRRSRLPFARRAARVAVSYGIPLQVLQALVSPTATHRRLARLQQRQRRTLRTPPGLDPRQRVEWTERLLSEDVLPLLPRIMPAAATGWAMLALAMRGLGTDATRADVVTVLRGLPHNVTTQMDLELWQLARLVRADALAAASLSETPPDQLARWFKAGTLPGTLQRGLTAFLHRYGQRSVAEIDIGVPRWADDPTYVLGVLAGYLRLTDPARAPDAVFARGAAEAEAMVDTLTARARQRSLPRAVVVRFALRRTRQLSGIRELPKACLIRALGAARTELAAVGVQLATLGRLDCADDIFYLDLTETHRALDGADLRGLVAGRKEVHAQELARRRVPRVLLSDGTEPEAPQLFPGGDGRTLRGTPASAGSVTGIARVVLDPADARLEPGELLVAPSTDPGWTPLFLTAGGLVMEMGGAISHGAVVAREYGIPAVVGVPHATDAIATGDRLTIDGAAGLVTVETD